MEDLQSGKSHGDPFPKKAPDGTCNARTRGGMYGPISHQAYCQKPAGWGTKHVGEGRCRLHGGNAGRPIEHGERSKYFIIRGWMLPSLVGGKSWREQLRSPQKPDKT